MFDHSVTHHIQKHILSVLLHQEFARFRDLRPPRVDTNLFSYHLKLLQRHKFIERVDRGYTLSLAGLSYVDRVNADKLFVRQQPKVVTMLLVRDPSGRILLQKRTKQPYINTWTLPYGKVHIDDETVSSGAKREAYEKLGLVSVSPHHVGDAYIRVHAQEEVLSSTLAHICRLDVESHEESGNVQWVESQDLNTLTLAPAVEQIVKRSVGGENFFFAEYKIEFKPADI